MNTVSVLQILYQTMKIKTSIFLLCDVRPDILFIIIDYIPHIFDGMNRQYVLSIDKPKQEAMYLKSSSSVAVNVTLFKPIHIMSNECRVCTRTSRSLPAHTIFSLYICHPPAIFIIDL